MWRWGVEGKWWVRDCRVWERVSWFVVVVGLEGFRSC